MAALKVHSILELEAFYFEAALATFVNGETRLSTISKIPKSNAYRYPESGEQDGLVYYDTCWSHDEYSGGSILIEAFGVPTWIMHYKGWCQYDAREVLTVLKDVLRSTYERKLFIGGRGPTARIGAGQFLSIRVPLLYQNSVDQAGSRFELFGGREHISPLSNPGHELFWHTYDGMLFRRRLPQELG